MLKFDQTENSEMSSRKIENITPFMMHYLTPNLIPNGNKVCFSISLRFVGSFNFMS